MLKLLALNFTFFKEYSILNYFSENARTLSVEPEIIKTSFFLCLIISFNNCFSLKYLCQIFYKIFDFLTFL